MDVGEATGGADHLLKDQPISNDVSTSLDEFHFDLVFPPTQPIEEITTGLAHNIPTRDIPPSLASLQLLRKYGSGFKKLKGGIILSDESSAETPALLGHRLSTGEIMEMAGARYVQYPTQMHDDYLMPVHPFGFALSGDLSRDEKRDAELAHLLLYVVEKTAFAL